jgi:hypothetical protein
MSANRINELWEPRIGGDATRQLRRNGYLTLAVWPSIFALALLCSFAVGSSNPTIAVLGVVGVGIAIVLFAVWVQSRRKLAAAMSAWFGHKIRSYELPRMRTQQFDSWCHERNLKRSPDPA